MKLTYAPASPFVRKVRVLLAEANMTDAVELIRVHTTPVATADEVASANPVGKIPALIRNESPAIYDSRVICQFLNDHVNADFYPERNRWDILTLEATGDAIMESGLAIVYEHRLRPPEGVNDAWVSAQWGKIERTASALNNRWMGHLTGPITMGHVAVACALGYLDFRLPDRDWRGDNPALADWYAEFVERPSMRATMPSD